MSEARNARFLARTSAALLLAATLFSPPEVYAQQPNMSKPAPELPSGSIDPNKKNIPPGSVGSSVRPAIERTPTRETAIPIRQSLPYTEKSPDSESFSACVTRLKSAIGPLGYGAGRGIVQTAPGNPSAEQIFHSKGWKIGSSLLEGRVALTGLPVTKEAEAMCSAQIGNPKTIRASDLDACYSAVTQTLSEQRLRCLTSSGEEVVNTPPTPTTAQPKPAPPPAPETAVNCNPRPPIKITTKGLGPDLLEAYIKVDGEPNRIVGIRIENYTPGTKPGVSFDPKNNNLATVTFSRAGIPGQPAQVNFTITDECGPWKTFIGGGEDPFDSPRDLPFGTRNL